MKQPLQNKIREMRILHGIVRQSTFCKMIGKSKAAVSAWENGKANPSIPTSIKIARIFGCTVEDLYIYDLSVDTPKTVDDRQTSLPVEEVSNEPINA
jgi:putative transcriptional regulator